MKPTIPTPEIIKQFNACVNLAIEFINDYKSDHDREKLVKRLSMVVLARPNICYLDPDVLSCYGIESEQCLWVECDADEIRDDNEAILDIVKNDPYEKHRICIGSSGPILVSIFGDAYYQLRKFNN